MLKNFYKKEPVYKYKTCNDCKGQGFITGTLSTNPISCMICNGSGSTIHGPHSIEAEQTLLYKMAWDFINGKKKGWYH
jgi:DnaJ-class molecular chaperone|tara:strand:+ start:619 stop:852 length:234 start_codon:yes stop_codon:yes gene_type:complete